MPSLPRKARNGDDFKSYTTSAINKLIDYLHSMRPKDSPDIKVKESASGVMFEFTKRPAKTPQVIGGGGGSGAAGLCIPDYLHPTAITPNQLYQPIGYPVWIMGHFNASPPMYQSDISYYTAQINLGDGNGNTESLRLFDLATQNQPKEINTIQNFVSLLIPGDFLFTIETAPNPLPASYFSVHLKYYPLLSNP